MYSLNPLVPKDLLNKQVVRLLSTTCTGCYPFRGKFPDPVFKTKQSRRSNRPLKKETYKEVLEAQRLRKPWEFTTQVDQKASWKHRKWMEPYLQKWVSTAPEGFKNKVLDLHYKEKRKAMEECENMKEHFSMLLDGYKGKKFVIPAFDHHFPQINMSYLYQYLTHTKYIHGVPYQISIDDDVVSTEFKSFVSFVEQLLVFREMENESLDDVENVYEKKQKMDSEFMKLIVSYLTATQLGGSSRLNYDNENSMFWIRGRGFVEEYLPRDISRAYQTHDRSLLQVTCKNRLLKFSSHDSVMSTTGNVPYCTFSPHMYEHDYTSYRNVIHAGQRMAVGDLDLNYQEAFEADSLSQLPPPLYLKNHYGHTQVCLLPPTYSREWYNENMEHGDITDQIEEHLKAHGIMSGWTWTASQASNAGHYMDNDVTEPWCSQIILFDGKYLSFFGYQLNTLAIDEDNVHNHERRNLCYGKTSVPLFDKVTKKGEVVGLNEEALRIIFKMLSKQKTYSDADVASYEANLETQEVNPESCALEDQKPLHVAAREQEETRLALIEEEKKAEEAKILNRIKRIRPVDFVKSLVGKK